MFGGDSFAGQRDKRQCQKRRAAGRAARGLIPGHLREHHRHPAGVGDPGKHEPRADEAGEERPGLELREPRQRHAEDDQRPGADPHLPLERHRLAAADQLQAGGFAGGRSPLDAGDRRQPRGEELLARLPAPPPRLADDIERSRLPGALGDDRLGIEPVEGDVSRPVDMGLAILRRGADIEELDRLPTAADLGEGGRADRVDHSVASWDVDGCAVGVWLVPTLSLSYGDAALVWQTASGNRIGPASQDPAKQSQTGRYAVPG